MPGSGQRTNKVVNGHQVPSDFREDRITAQRGAMRQPGAMALDLAEVAEALNRYGKRWMQAGISVEAVTWRDIGGPWPYPLKIERGVVVDADSVGVRASRDEQEGRLVVYRGGWAELEYWNARDEPLMEVSGYDDPLDLPALELLLQRFGTLFVGRVGNQNT